MPQSTCIIDGCEAPSRARGMCKPHYRKDHYRRNKAHENASNKAYRDARPEYWKERWQKFYAENKDTLAEARREWYYANHEAALERAVNYRRNNPGASDRWRKTNPEQWALRNRENQRRRQTKGGDPVSYPAILERDGMTCHLCLEEIPSLDDLHMDHVIPLSKGGPHSEDNIKPSHAHCNLRKGSRLVA